MPIKIIPEIKRVEKATDPRSIPAADYRDAWDNFRRYFRTSASDPLNNHEEELEWDSLYQLVQNSAIVGMKGVVLYHGLSGDQLMYGFRVIGFTPLPLPNPNNDDYAFNPAVSGGAGGENPTHVLDRATNRLVAVPADWAARVTEYKTILVDRDGAGTGTFGRVDTQLTDPLKVIFPWEEELFKLWFDNRARLAQNRPMVLIRAIAMYHTSEAPNGYRHGIGMSMRYYDSGNQPVDLLDDNDEILAYMNKAADLGHRCPPRCGSYKTPVDLSE